VLLVLLVCALPLCQGGSCVQSAVCCYSTRLHFGTVSVRFVCCCVSSVRPLRACPTIASPVPLHCTLALLTELRVFPLQTAEGARLNDFNSAFRECCLLRRPSVCCAACRSRSRHACRSARQPLCRVRASSNPTPLLKKPSRRCARFCYLFAVIYGIPWVLFVVFYIIGGATGGEFADNTSRLRAASSLFARSACKFVLRF
jgi:hypothetical protein